MHVQTRTHTHTHACTYMHTHTHTYTYTRAQIHTYTSKCLRGSQQEHNEYGGGVCCYMVAKLHRMPVVELFPQKSH